MRPVSLKALAFACAASTAVALPALSQAAQPEAPNIAAPDAVASDAVASVAAASVAAAPSGTEASGQVVKYAPSYFAEFQPTTSFDMVTRVPGFVFDGGESARGFSGTAGNVLIDGQRPASKSELNNTLSNINAAQVDHLELITGGAPGIDMHGHRQIVNVVRKTDAKPNFSVLGIWRNLDGRTNSGVLLFTYNDNRGGKATDITADIFTFFDNGAQNARRLTTNSSGTKQLDIHQYAGGKGIESQASHARPLWGGKVTLNGTYNPSIYIQDSTYIGSDTGTEKFVEKDTPSELGGQYERKFAHGLNVNLNVLTRHERGRIVDIYRDSDGTSEYRALNLSNERILNGHISWQKREGLSLSVGTETAFNSLDSTSSFALGSGSPTADHIRVQEDRTESFVSANWKASKKLSIEGELKVETSTISVPAANRSDSFTYYKPRLQAVYAFSDKTKLSWKTIRQVDQLSFDDFASSVQLETSHVTLGNTSLVPQKDWLNTLILEHSFWDKGAVSIAYEHYAYEDTSDFIAVFDGPKVFTAVGNIGKSQWDYLHLKVDAPLDRFHIPHGTISVDYTYRHTQVADPITGQDRHVSGKEPHVYAVSFSQEFPKAGTSWGLDIESAGKDRNYLANELTDAYFNPWSQVWFQYTSPKKLQFKVMVKNPLSLRYTQDRVVYEGLRGHSPVAYTQHTTSKIPPMIEMRMKKNF